MSTENRAGRAARRGAVSAIIVAVAAPAFALSAPAVAAQAEPQRPPTTTTQTFTTQTAATSLAAPQQPGDTVGQIANALIDSRLYVTSNAGDVLSQADQNQIKTSLAGASDADIRAVVVGNDVTQTQVGQMLRAVANRVGEGQTYVAVTADGSRMGAISRKLDTNEINQIVTRTNGAPLKDRLVQFSDLAEERVDDKAQSSAVAGYVVLGLFLTLLAAAVGMYYTATKRRRQREEQQMADLKAGVQEDVTLLGEDIARLDLDVMDPALPSETRADYERALNSYDEAKTATERATRPQDMQEVTTALEDGRYYMTATRARLAGEPVPERRAPCFFNPQHGPSARDVMWAPPGGTPRSVPACEADAQAVLHGTDPDIRMVPYGDGRQPYWNAGPAYAPYAGGYYRGYGGFDLLGGLMIGTMLGSMMGPGIGWGGMGYGAGDAGGFGGDGGDIGGGWDFGGGDFGDFGGF